MRLDDRDRRSNTRTDLHVANMQLKVPASV